MSKRNIRPQESGVRLRENLRLSVNFTAMQAIPDVEFKKQIVDQKIIEQPDYPLIKRPICSFEFGICVSSPLRLGSIDVASVDRKGKRTVEP